MSADNPQNPYAVSLPPGSAASLKSIGRGGEIFAAEIHGKYYTAAYNARLFSFNVTAQTIPVIASGLASKFAVYNPSNSTVNAELVDLDIGVVLVTTVVDTIGMYWDGPTLASQATLTTIGVVGTNWFAGLVGGAGGQVTPYTALTHKTTPVRIAIVGQFGAVAATNDTPLHYDFDGKIILPVGHLVSVAMSTTVWTTSGMDLAIRWMEVPTT